MKQTVYRLNYEQEYHCKCAACRRTCCRNDWDIDLTEAEYERDRSLCRQLALDEQKVFEKKPEGARLKFDGQGLCPFLSQEGLCSLRLESGRCSGAVCDDFPMLTIRFRNDLYQFPTPACEAIALQLSCQRGKIRFCGEKGAPREEKDREALQQAHIYAEIDDAMIGRRERPMLRCCL